MRGLADLLRAPDGVALLAENGIFLDQQAFAAALRTPARPDLSASLGVDPCGTLVYVGQQVCADYTPATATKFALARDLGDGIVVAVLWHDMYQADADRFGTRILPPGGAKARGLWLVPRSAGSQEPRFIPLDSARLEDAFTGLRAWIEHAPTERRGQARGRLEAWIRAVEACAPATLSDATGAMATHLLRAHLRFDPPTTFASTMADRRLFDPSLNEVLASLDEVRHVFNRSVERLLARDVDPQVRPLDEDYLPLHYSDPATGDRVRLRHERSGPDHWAVALTRDGRTLRFHLGIGRPSLGELEADRRWSLDVSMPLYHNDLASGWIAGRSTALYGLVFNDVLRDVLGRTPIPALVPAALGEESDGVRSHTMLFDHLLGRSMGDAQ